MHETGVGWVPLDNRADNQRCDAEILCRDLCRNPGIPAHVECSRTVSLWYKRRATDNEQTRMNTGHSSCSVSLRVVRLLAGQRIDTEEVDGSSPFGPTIQHFF